MLEFNSLEEMFIYDEEHPEVIISFGADKAYLLDAETLEEVASIRDERAGVFAYRALAAYAFRALGWS